MLKGISDYWKSTDRACLFLCLACSSLSVFTLYAIGQTALSGNVRRALVQAGAAALGLACAVFLSMIDYRSLAESWRYHAALTWGLVLLTFVIGYAPEGTTNKAWIRLPMGQSLQPTELAKISFILTLALHLSKVGDRINEPRELAKVLLHILGPAALIHLQGDDGTMIIFLLIAFTMLFSAGVSWKYILAAVPVVGVVAPLAWHFVMGEYQKTRILGLFDPDGYASFIWQQIRGRTAIGSGGILGKGFFGEHYTVPLVYNDFIFAYIAESAGFVGALLVLALLLGLGLRTLNTARRSKDTLGYFICVGIFAMLLWQTVVNVGMCLLLMPVIGITLPLFSAGGTSVLTVYLAIGVSMSVYVHNKQNLFAT